MYCGKCGSPIPDGNSFCSKCGAPISQEVKQTTINTNPQPVPPITQTSQPPRMSAGRVIGRIILVIVLIAIIIEVLKACTMGMYQQGML